jgi:hypothetical protein
MGCEAEQADQETPIKYALFVKYEYNNDDVTPTARTWVFEGFVDSPQERDDWIRYILAAATKPITNHVRVINYCVHGLPL